MAPPTIRMLIKKCMKNLTAEELDEFKDALIEGKGVPTSSVEGKDFLAVTKVIDTTFGDEALKVVIELLNDIGCKKKADDLDKEAKELTSKAGSSQSAGASAGTDHVTPEADGEHLVDKHRDCLIQRMTNIPQILDELLNKVIDQETYDEIMALRPSQKQMRELYKSLNTTQAKDVFYKILIENQPLLMQYFKRMDAEVSTVADVQQLLLEILNDLSDTELKEFKNILQSTVSKKNLPDISWMWSYGADRADIMNQMVHTYGQQSVGWLTKEVLMDMKRTDLLQRLSKPSSGLKGPSRSLEHEDFGSAMQDSSDWTKLEPEVNSTDADEAPTYSLQSEAGNFECSVSGLRWDCKETVSFKYQFCPWGEPTKRMELMSYMPAGPLMDIKVTAGKLDVVYLPHWICIDNNPEIRDKFAVLHIDDCGDVVEKVAEVTSAHVKLSEPHFSLLMAFVKFGLSVDINCYMLIYKSNKAFLTLHVYLIPCDPGLKEELDNRHSKKGYQIIEKPHPEMPLRVNDFFILTAGLDSEEIDPEKLMLRYNRYPNFFEVHIKNANTDFKLMLRRENEHEPVRTCTIRKDEYQSAADIQDAAPADKPSVLPPPTQLSAAEQGEDEHFVDKHRLQLIEKVSNIAPILDELLDEKVIQQEKYSIIRALQTPREKMRELYSGPVQASWACKDIFYKILEKKEPRLIDALKEKK